MDGESDLRNEIRRDYRTGRFTIIAPDRGKRPEDFFQPKKEPRIGTKCPFDPGNEEMTVEIMSVGNPWKVRVIENKYPEFSPEIPFEEVDGKLEYISGYGYNEVVIDTPIHNMAFDKLKFEEMRLWFDTLIEREADLYTKNYIKYVQIFKNSGPESGESLVHPHTQIMAWPAVIGTIKDEIDHIKGYKDRYNKCLYEDLKELEADRILIETEKTIAVAPYASRFAGESMIVPKRHVNYLQDLTAEEKDDFINVLILILKTNKKLFGDFSYNFSFHDIKNEPDFHLHLEIYPRLSIPAGVEFGQNVFVNQLPPEIYSESFIQKLKESI
ncbi:MAG: galactose-1-phosphate uridylyltransferase [Candidatus Acidifodinimicrobium sp.]